MSKTLSSALDRDIADQAYGPLSVVGLVRSPGSTPAYWVIAKVEQPTNDDDRYRAYLDDIHRERTGLICLNAATESDARWRARNATRPGPLRWL